MPGDDSSSASDSNGQKRKTVREKARRSIVGAFNRLVLAGKLRTSGVAEVVKHANVARSTFYEHFEGKRDLLRAALEPLCIPIADVAAGRRPAEALLPFLAHVRGLGALSGDFFAGPDRALIESLLADLIEERLPEAMALPRALLARTLACAQLALVTGWLTEHSTLHVHRLVDAMARTADATRRAFH